MTEGTAASAQLTVHSMVCITARTAGVAVRDEAGHNLDFPGAATNVRICPGGVTITTAARTLPAGSYTAFGYWQDYANVRHDLARQALTVAAAPTGPTVPGPTTPTDPDNPVPHGSLAWSDEFDGSIAWGSKWVGDRSSAYRYGDHNPDDNKLDWLDPAAVQAADGAAVFTAKPSGRTLESGRRAWETGLLTTEGSGEGFRVHAGDYVETRVQLPEGSGAWPALWTWRNGGSEVDSFEYHPDNPHLLELTNHVRRGGKYYSDPEAVAPGQWVTIGTRYGVNSVEWYVNGERVWSDGRGVGRRWTAYLILNLSVGAGKYHPGPSGDEPLTTAVDYVRVYR